MDADQPTAEAIAIKNGEILFVGNRKTAENYKRFSTKVYEVPNGTVLPGFIDLTLIHISEPTRRYAISYAVFCLTKKNGTSSNAVT